MLRPTTTLLHLARRATTIPQRLRLLPSPSSSPIPTTFHPSNPFTTSPPRSQQMAEATTNNNTTSPAPITPTSLTATLQSKLQTTHVAIEDMSGGCGQAFNAVIVSAEFEKKTLLARHRLVNAALKEEIAQIHAWTPRCLTPEQWEKEKEKQQ